MVLAAAFWALPRIRPCLAVALAFFAIVPGTRAQVPAEMFPAVVGGAVRDEVKDYETTAPGLGWGVQYMLSGWRIDVFIYDFQFDNIPPSIDSPMLLEQFEMSKNDIFGVYGRQTTEITEEFSVEVDNAHGFLCAEFGLLREGRQMASFLCLTSWNDNFVKFRLTTPENPSAAERTRWFMRRWAEYLW